jgi:hypothetical protein
MKVVQLVDATGKTFEFAIDNVCEFRRQLDDAFAITLDAYRNNSFWDTVPEWANYFAIDDDRTGNYGWVFAEEPYLETLCGSWVVENDSQQAGYKISIELHDMINKDIINFADTLKIRPGVEKTKPNLVIKYDCQSNAVMVEDTRTADELKIQVCDIEFVINELTKLKAELTSVSIFEMLNKAGLSATEIKHFCTEVCEHAAGEKL